MKKISLYFALLIALPSIGQRFNSKPPVFDTNYQTLLTTAAAANVSTPTNYQQTSQNTLILAAKSCGCWTKWDAMYVMATNGAAKFADYNWKNPGTYTAVRTKTPAFTRNVGFTGNLTDAYMDMGFRPIDLVQYTINNGEQVIYYRNLPSTFNTGQADGVRDASSGTSNVTAYNPLYGSNVVLGNTNGLTSVAATSDAQFTNADGMRYGGKSVANTEFVKQGTGSRISYSNTGGTQPSYNMTLFGLNTAGTVGGFNGRTISFYAIGAALTTTEEDCFNTAFNAYLASLALEPLPKTIGTRYKKNFWTDLSDFTNNGATVSVTNNFLHFTGVFGTFTHSLDVTSLGATRLGTFTETALVKVGQKDATSYGFGPGIRSNNTSQALPALNWFNATSSGGYSQQMGGATPSAIGAGTSSLTFSLGDIIEVKTDVVDWVTTVSARNVTTGTAAVSLATNNLTGVANTGYFSMFSIGGIFDLLSLEIKSNEYYKPDLLFVGDSKFAGFSATRTEYAIPYAIRDYKGVRVYAQAGGSDRIVDAQNHAAEVNNIIKPTTIILCIGRNDKAGGASDPTIATNYDALVSSYTGAGARVIHLTGLYETSGLDQTALRTHILATYASADIIDTLPTTIGLAGDNVHPNDTGMATIVNLIITSGKLP